MNRFIQLNAIRNHTTGDTVPVLINLNNVTCIVPALSGSGTCIFFTGDQEEAYTHVVEDLHYIKQLAKEQ